jgi:hypothetical protein
MAMMGVSETTLQDALFDQIYERRLLLMNSDFPLALS